MWSETANSFSTPEEALNQYEKHDTITLQYLRTCIQSDGSVSAGSHPRTQPFTSTRFHAQNIGASLRNLLKLVDVVNKETRDVKSDRSLMRNDFERRILAASGAEREKLRLKLSENLAASTSSFEKITRSALKMVQSKVWQGGLHGVGDLNGHLVVNLCALVPGVIEDVEHCNVAMVCKNNNTSDFLRDEYNIDDDSSRLSLLSSLKSHNFYGIGYQPSSVIENMLCEYGRHLRRMGGNIRWFDTYAVDNSRQEGRLMRIDSSANSRHIFTRSDEVGSDVVLADAADGHPSVTKSRYPVPVLGHPSSEIKTDAWWADHWSYRSSEVEKEDWVEIKDLQISNQLAQARRRKSKGARKKLSGKSSKASSPHRDHQAFIPTRWSAAPPRNNSKTKRFRSQVASLIWSMSSVAEEAESLFSTLEFQSMTLDQQTVVLAREACAGAIASHPNVFDDYVEPYLDAEDASEEKVHPEERAIRSLGRLSKGNFKRSRSTKDNGDDPWVPSFHEAQKIMTKAGGACLIPVYLLDQFPRNMKHRFDCAAFISSSTNVSSWVISSSFMLLHLLL